MTMEDGTCADAVSDLITPNQARREAFRLPMVVMQEPCCLGTSHVLQRLLQDDEEEAVRAVAQHSQSRAPPNIRGRPAQVRRGLCPASRRNVPYRQKSSPPKADCTLYNRLIKVNRRCREKKTALLHMDGFGVLHHNAGWCTSWLAHAVGNRHNSDTSSPT